MRKQQAFTLIELSIVLVILGLLVGGVLMGQDLMRQQRVRSALVEAKSYSTAIQQFSDKYGALPGDMRDAEHVFGNAEGGAATTDCATPAASATTDGFTTCNGNGNGTIDTATETFWLWQQLAAGGFIATSSKLTGISSGGTVHAVPGINTPQTAIVGATFWHYYTGGVSTGDTTYFAGDYTNSMIFGGATSSSWPSTAVLTPTQAYDFDKKVDDGAPGTGDIRTFASTWMTANVGACNSTDAPTTSIYSATSSSTGCILILMKTFNTKKAG